MFRFFLFPLKTLVKKSGDFPFATFFEFIKERDPIYLAWFLSKGTLWLGRPGIESILLLILFPLGSWVSRKGSIKGNSIYESIGEPVVTDS